MCVAVCGWSPGRALKMELDWLVSSLKPQGLPTSLLVNTRLPVSSMAAGPVCTGGACDAASIGAGKALP